MRKIVLHGSYYGDNFGDTLFVIEYINWLKELKDFEQKNVFLPFASNRVRRMVQVSERKGLMSIITSDLVVFIGGGYLGEPPRRKNIWSYRLIIRHLSIAALAYIFKKQYIFIGVGAGPLSNKLARKLTVFLCNKSKKTIVRDEESKKYLNDYGVLKDRITVTSDSILTLESKDIERENKDEVRRALNINCSDNILIGVHLPVSMNEINEVMLIIKDLKIYCANIEKYKIVVFNDFYKEDYNYLAYSIIKQEFDYDKVIFAEYKNPNYLIALIGELNIVITTKLHCGIVANCLGKFTLSISVHDKTRRLYNQLGLLRRNVSLREYEQGKLINMLSEYNSSDEYINVPRHIRDLAYRNKEEFLNFVKE